MTLKEKQIYNEYMKEYYHLNKDVIREREKEKRRIKTIKRIELQLKNLKSKI
jgi:hypothetical protein